MNEYRPLRVALLGAGSVGAQVARLLLENKAELAARVGAELELVGIAVRDLNSKRADGVPVELLTTDAEALILSADIVIEVMGGIEPARTYILQALNSGSDVITANKALLATHGTELFDTAEQVGAQLYFEAAVAAAIPIIRPLRESLAGDKVTRVMGIVNGSTNYILDRMDTAGISLEEAMEEATKLGYLEADPTLDVEGYDAAQKAAILAYLAFHTEVPIEKVYREGMTKVTPEQIKAAQRDGYVIKLLAIAELTPSDEISVRVHPVMLEKAHPLASVRDAFNAVFVEAESAGPLMFYGRGAGGAPTASAILGDVLAVSRHIAHNSVGQRETDYADRDIAPIETTKTKFLIRLEVQDKSGVLAAIAQVFATQGVSIQTVDQNGRDVDAELVIVTHLATEGELKATVDALKKMDIVSKVSSVIRVEGVSA